MMNAKLEAAARQAITALEQCGQIDSYRNYELESAAIASLQEALAEKSADENLLEARAYADQRWDGENVPVEWLRHFVDGLGSPSSPPIVGIGVAVIGHKHFGNPIPAAWYAAAKELLAQGFAPTQQQSAEPVAMRYRFFGEDMKTGRLNINLPESVLNDIREMAQKDGSTATAVVMRSIKAGMFMSQQREAGNELLIQPKGADQPTHRVIL